MLQRSGLHLLVHQQQQQVRASIYQTEMQICSPSEERAPVICMFLFSQKKQQMKKNPQLGSVSAAADSSQTHKCC